jgi:hypothetical protein
VLQSVSRLVGEVVTPEVRAAGQEVRRLMAAYREKEDLIAIGAYQPGADPLTDAAIATRPAIEGFLRQSADELAYVQDALRLPPEQVRAIERLKTVKRAYSQAFWINGTRGRATVTLRVGPHEYWLATSDPVADLPRRARMLDACGGDGWAALERLAAEDLEAGR